MSTGALILPVNSASAAAPQPCTWHLPIAQSVAFYRSAVCSLKLALFNRLSATTGRSRRHVLKSAINALAMSTGARILPINSAGAETRPSSPVIARFVSARHWRNRACNRVRQKATTPGDRKSSNGHRGVARNHGLRPRERSMTKRSKHRCHLSARLPFISPRRHWTSLTGDCRTH
jgi:hypothetical protein